MFADSRYADIADANINIGTPFTFEIEGILAKLHSNSGKKKEVMIMSVVRQRVSILNS